MSRPSSILSRSALVRLLGAAVLMGFSVPGLEGESRPGIVRAQIINGTTGEDGQAEWATLFSLASGMEPVASAQNVSGRFTLEGFEVDADQTYLFQVTYEGVNYNEVIRFGPGSQAEATITVYDVTREWVDMEVKTVRYLLRREHDRLRVDKLYVVENKTDPKKTVYDPEGSFKFHMPPDVVERRSISASSASGMPIPQSASPLADGSGYVSPTAFKPGSTDVAISYDVDYSSGGYRLEEQAFYPFPDLLALVSPPDIELQAKGWENLGLEPDGRFVILRQSTLAPGTPIELGLSGGSEHAADLPPSSSGGRGSLPEGHPPTEVTRLPDRTRAQKWIVALLMGAALAYGLLTAMVPAPANKPVGRSHRESGRQPGQAAERGKN